MQRNWSQNARIIRQQHFGTGIRSSADEYTMILTIRYTCLRSGETNGPERGSTGERSTQVADATTRHVFRPAYVGSALGPSPPSPHSRRAA